MIPNWWTFSLLALAAYRVWRLAAVDTFPPIEWLRNRIVWYREPDDDSMWHQREAVAEFLKCPWCSGAWIVLAWWVAWLAWPHGIVVAAVPFAVSAVVGLVAKNLDV